MTKSSKKFNTKREQDPSTRGPSTGRGDSDAQPSREKVRGSRTRRKGIAGVPGSKNPERRCTATVFSTGLRCKRAAIKGGNVCTSHGGAAPQVQKSAKQRLVELADPAIAALSKIVRDEDADDTVRVRASLGILDRIGLGPGQTIDLNVGLSKWEESLTIAYGGEVIDGKAVWPEKMLGGVDRSEMADPPRELGGGEHWEDFHQAAYDAQADADHERDDAEAERGRIHSMGPVVRGEVVDSDPPAHLRGD